MDIGFMVEAMFSLITGADSQTDTARCLSPAGPDTLMGHRLTVPYIDRSG